MHLVQTLDVALLRFINVTLSNPVFDWLMPLLSGNALFAPALVLALAWLVWKGGARGRVFAALLILTIWLGDTYVCKTLKQTIGRPRPFVTLTDINVLVGKGQSLSMPSSHAANWGAAIMLTAIYYRRSAFRAVLPVGLAVGLSRIYNGVHYPSDVLVGFLLGSGYAACGAWTADALWRRVGRRWFPIWWTKLPSLLRPEIHESKPLAAEQTDTESVAESENENRKSELEAHWLRLGYLVIAALLLFRLAYLAGGRLELSKDEAYQWLWSKHLALSYYSKPPGIAYLQFLGTSLFGDTAFGVRFFSPVIAAILGLAVLRFMARSVSARVAFWLVLIVNFTPLMAVGAILMTIDPPMVLCWTLAMIAGWRAVQPDGTTRQWLLAGLVLGLGFLFKYTAAMQLACWAVFFLLHKPARVHLRRPGPYLALLIFLLCTVPVLIWNAQHGWITVEHVSYNAGLHTQWRPTLRYFWDFLFAESALLNPVFFGGALWAMVAFWRQRPRQPLLVFLFCMGPLVFLGHWAWSLRSRILPNWIAPSVIPMICLMAAWWTARWREGRSFGKGWFVAGVMLGILTVTLMHESRLIARLAGRPLPGEMEPHRRVSAWKETAAVVEAARAQLEREGKPAFIICDHYGMTSLVTFYLPEARRAALRGEPMVFPSASDTPKNQFFFWPEYRYWTSRVGQNAVFALELDTFRLERGWIWKWLRGKPVNYAPGQPTSAPPPEFLQRQFESVTDLGMREIKLGERVFRRLVLFECRNLRANDGGN